jgi:hypothetical protein
MDTKLKRITGWAVLAGATAVLGLGLPAATASADPAPMVCPDPNSPPSTTNRCAYQWCPGSPELKNMPNWDRSVCHPWYFDENSPVTNSTIIEGFPPRGRRGFSASRC